MAEQDCGVLHETIEDAIRHAREHLGAKPKASGQPWLDSTPYWGTLGILNVNLVVGFQISSRRRWRLDWSGEPKDDPKGIHVNEENFDEVPSRQKTVHRVKTHFGEEWVRLRWRNWTSRYAVPGLGHPPFNQDPIRNK